MKKVPIKYYNILDSLRKVEPIKWQKVYRDEFDASGNKISVHYFEHKKSGKVFDVKTKNDWSNK